jgi:hypothetical protein
MRISHLLYAGVLKGWCYNVLFLPPALDWSKQIVVITGGQISFVFDCAKAHMRPGSSGIGELTANTLANCNINVIVLDINPIQTENSPPCIDRYIFN